MCILVDLLVDLSLTGGGFFRAQGTSPPLATALLHMINYRCTALFNVNLHISAELPTVQCSDEERRTGCAET